jgi:hypothetical protein
MTKKDRTILFYSFFFLFLVIASISVLYSQGYRFDTKNFKLVKTGGIFIQTEPKQAQIFIDGKLTKKTDFFIGSALISKLLPREYQIRVEKEGFLAWEKTLEVKEKEVTEAKNIVLFPINPGFENIASTTASTTAFWNNLVQKATTTATSVIGVSDFTLKKEGAILYILNPKTKEFDKLFEPLKGFSISPDSQKIAFYSENEIWLLFIKKNTGSETPYGEKVFLNRFSEKIGNALWLNSDYLIINVGNKIEISEIDTRGRLNVWDLGEFKTPEIFWSKNEKKLYVLSQESVFVSRQLLP